MCLEQKVYLWYFISKLSSRCIEETYCYQYSRVCLLEFLCSGVWFCVLLGPCICFVSFYYLGLYVLGDNARVGWGSFMRAGHLCVLIHIWARLGVAVIGLVWAFQWNSLADCSRAVLFCGSFVLFVSCVCHAFASVHCCLVVICWESVTSWVSFVKFNCVFVTNSCGILGLVWNLIVSIPDLCRLSYFHIQTMFWMHRINRLSL